MNKVKQVALNTAIVTVITMSIAVMLLCTSCSTANGAFRDIKSGAELGISLTQKAADKQMADGLAWSVKEQTRVMNNGQMITRALGR